MRFQPIATFLAAMTISSGISGRPGPRDIFLMSAAMTADPL